MFLNQKNPNLYIRNNIEGTKKLLSLVQAYSIKRIIFSSSAAVYGDQEIQPIKETATLSPKVFTHIQKLSEELIQKQAKTDKLKAISLRYFNPIGAHEDCVITDNFEGINGNIMAMLLRVATGLEEKLNIFGGDYPTTDGTGERDYIHINDIVDGHFKALEKLELIDEYEVYNLGTGSYASVLELIHTLEKVNGLQINYQITSRRSGDLARSYADPSKANAELNWEARYNLETMCKDAWEAIKMELIKLKDAAINASKKAGEYLNSQKDSKKEILSEIGRDIKLEIDQNTEKLIRGDLQSTGIEVLGEEFGGGKPASLQWVIDPLDGTANYFRGLDQCCVSIALLDRSEAVIGIIYNFNTNEIYSAVKGHGAFLNDLPIKVSDITEKNKASLTTGFPASESLESSMEFLEGLKEWKKIRMFGSAALSCAYVASGKCDFYAEKGVYLWDFAAGICLVQEAGGNVKYESLDDQRYSVKFSNNLL